MLHKPGFLRLPVGEGAESPMGVVSASACSGMCSCSVPTKPLTCRTGRIRWHTLNHARRMARGANRTLLGGARGAAHTLNHMRNFFAFLNEVLGLPPASSLGGTISTGESSLGMKTGVLVSNDTEQDAVDKVLLGRPTPFTMTDTHVSKQDDRYSCGKKGRKCVVNCQFTTIILISFRRGTCTPS